MADQDQAQKTEQATPRRREEAFKRGQYARSAEVQKMVPLIGGAFAFLFFGPQGWQYLLRYSASLMHHLHDTTISPENLQTMMLQGMLVVGLCAGPLALATMISGMLASGIQSQFQGTPDALQINWDRLNLANGFKKFFSISSVVNLFSGFLKLGLVVALSYSTVCEVFRHPIFYSSVGAGDVAEFLAHASMKILFRVGFVMLLVAAADYAYQVWKTNRDLMMTKTEVKEEMKQSEGDPQMKSRLRRRGRSMTFNRMLAEVPKADVIVRNPTRFAVALRYDRKTMGAPRIIAKGTRWNAIRILEVAEQHQIPMVENQPLARMLYKQGKVGGEIPEQFYKAVAEILAWVYRTNRYRYYTENNRA